MTGWKNHALQIPPIVPYKALGKFPKALYGTTGGACIREVLAVHDFSVLYTGSPSSKYMVYATVCVYKSLYGEITDRKKNCVNNCLI